jgi:hypothetical protein
VVSRVRELSRRLGQVVAWDEPWDYEEDEVEPEASSSTAALSANSV